MRFLIWLTRRLEARWRARTVIALALVLALPSLFAPLVADEHLQASRWRARRDVVGFLGECFVFASGDLAEGRARAEHLGAWWAAPDLRVAFWRPLSAATHALDLALWPGSAALMHAHTLVWFAALLALLALLFRRLLPPRAATLALALYAWDDARGGLLSWVANRHALLAGVFGVGALLAHDRWRRDGWRRGAWLGPALFAAGLLSSEMALATTALLFGHARWIDREGSRGRRLARLAPYLVVAAAWQAAYSAGGFGVIGSGGYAHPLLDPGGYLARLPARALALVLGQLTPFAADFWPFSPPAAQAVIAVVGVAFLVAVARVARAPLARAASSRLWLVGAGLAVLPVAAASPGDRNLVFVGVGASAALALVLDARAAEPPSSRGARLVVGALAVFHLALGPAMLPLKCLANVNLDAMRAGADASIPRGPEVAAETLVVVSAASEGAIYFVWAQRDAAGVPTPRGTRILATGFAPTTVTRTDAQTLRVSPEGGFLARELHRLMRSPARRFRPGDVVALSDMRATVTDVTPDGRPSTVEFRFATPLESAGRRWMRGVGMGLVPWRPPAVGETVVVPAPL
jgi:hypothetical protein